MATAQEQWKVLCDEFTAARDAETAALAKMNQEFFKFWPTDETLKAFEAAHQRTNDVVKRMDEFVAKGGK